MVDWNNILSKCSLELMELIVAYEEKLLCAIREEIRILKDSLQSHQSLTVYSSLNEDLA